MDRRCPGTAKIGAIVAAISTFSTARELAWFLEHCGASALIMLSAFRGRRFLEPLRALCPELDHCASGALRSSRLPALRSVVMLDGPPPAAAFAPDAFLAHGEAVEMSALAMAQAAVTPEDICYILYTSGSTAAPKGVSLPMDRSLPMASRSVSGSIFAQPTAYGSPCRCSGHSALPTLCRRS